MTAAGRPRIVTFLTDFGDSDSYVGQMKGVLLSVCPEARIIDLTHHVPAQDILEGAFQLATAWRAFPRGTVHVVVVDPGVGTARRLVGCRIGGQEFLAPDNGLLTLVLHDAEPDLAVHLDDPAFWRCQVSRTFHGRDVLASVAGHICSGQPLESVGSSIDATTLHRKAIPATVEHARGLIAPLLSIDHFGNCRTLVRREQLPEALDRVRVRVRGAEIRGVKVTYQDVRRGEPVALFGSNGMLELAVNGGSAAQRYAVRVLDRITIEWD
jgi:S-adenosyl-L-methionine hydrolase (adenosine-forming)